MRRGDCWGKVGGVYRFGHTVTIDHLKRDSSPALFPEGQVRALQVRNRVLSPQILALVSKDTDMLSDEAFAADHQAIHQVTHTLSVDA